MGMVTSIPVQSSNFKGPDPGIRDRKTKVLQYTLFPPGQRSRTLDYGHLLPYCPQLRLGLQ